MSSDTHSSELPTLLRTKLHRPQVAADLVPRPRLLERLDQHRGRPLTLVSAGAGYGKTTLVSTWLEACERSSAPGPPTRTGWLSLDEDDNNLALFLSYFLAAVQTTFPNAGEATLALLRAATLPPTPVLARSLINELDQIEQPFILVLDDYHHIRELAVHDLLTELLRHPPRSLHLVLVSRKDPMLSLTTLRARDQVTEIRTPDLRFTKAETAAFLEQKLGVPDEEITLDALIERFEGWAAGLRLVTLSLRHRDSLDLSPARLGGEVAYVTDYLMAEVLAGQPPATQDFLLKTSILDRLNGPLCDVVAGLDEPECDGQAYLEWLGQENLFTIPLDDQRQWYRYHHLFQELLQQQLARRHSPPAIAALHARASAWLAQNGLIDEALRHALLAGDLSAAAQLVEQHGRTLLNEDQWHILEKWMAKLPDDIIQQQPRLLIAKAWVSYYRFALWAIPHLLESIETTLDDEAITQPLWGEVDFFWGHHWYWQGQSTRSLDLLRRALERIPKVHHLARGEAELFWGLASLMSGQKEEAVQKLNRWLYDDQAPHPGRQTKLLGSLIFIYLLSGELPEVAQLAQQAQDMAAKHNNTYIRAWASYLQAYTHYCWHDLENATHHFAAAVENRYILHTAAAVDSLAGLALTYQALGQPDRAKATMADLLEFSQDTNDPAYITIARSCQARLSLLQGRLASAVRWLQTADLSTDASVMFYWLEIPRLTRCRVLITQGTEASLQKAVDLLEDYRQEIEGQHNIRQLIDILLLQTLAYHKQAQFDEALDTLERAVTLAEPGGFIRPFVELGPSMAFLLNQLRSRGVAPDYIPQVLAAFTEETKDQGRTTKAPDSPPAGVVGPPAPSRVSSSVIEPLTDRELEVLELLAQRRTNQEIAAQLVISSGTVKQHTHNIYQKLNVKGRRQAVATATELGILSSGSARR